MEYGMMLGDLEALMLNQQIIRTSGAKRILDIGVFTGASSLAAALALPEDKAGCKIVACDISQGLNSIEFQQVLQRDFQKFFL